jgi:hypothetical protein
LKGEALSLYFYFILTAASVAMGALWDGIDFCVFDFG